MPPSKRLSNVSFHFTLPLTGPKTHVNMEIRKRGHAMGIWRIGHRDATRMCEELQDLLQANVNIALDEVEP